MGLRGCWSRVMGGSITCAGLVGAAVAAIVLAALLAYGWV